MPSRDVCRLGKDYRWQKYSALPLASGMGFSLQACQQNNASLSIFCREAYFVHGWCDRRTRAALLIRQLEPASGSSSTAGNLRDRCSPSLLLPLAASRLASTLTPSLLMAKDTDRVHHAFLEAVLSCGHQILRSDPSDEKIPWAAPALRLGPRQSGIRL